jgi:hypothetical protein
MILRCYSLLTTLALRTPIRTLGISRPHKYCARLSLEFYKDGGYVLIIRETEDDATGYEIEVGVKRMRIVKSDSDGHDAFESPRDSST